MNFAINISSKKKHFEQVGKWRHHEVIRKQYSNWELGERKRNKQNFVTDAIVYYNKTSHNLQGFVEVSVNKCHEILTTDGNCNYWGASTMSSTATLLMYFLSTSWVLHCNLSVKLACKLRLRQPSYRMRSCRTIFLNRMLCLHICVLPFSHTNTAYQWGGSWTALLDPLCRMMAGQIFLFFLCKVWLKKKDAHI